MRQHDQSAWGQTQSGDRGATAARSDHRVVDANGEPVADGAAGEVVIKGPNVMRGYLNRPEETAKTIIDGWLHTGDIGRLDEDGYLVLVDRAKDMIIRGGENIYPREIEAVVHQLPAIAEAAVVGRPNAVYGEEPVLFVSLHPGKQLEVDAIHEHLSESLSKYKLPVEITILDDLPKNAVGKVAKTTATCGKNYSRHRRTEMSFTKPDLPAVDPHTFLTKPLMERMRILTVNWAENGFGSPRMVHTVYIAKLVLFYALGGVLIATLTSGLPAFWHVSEWWSQPIVYQKAVLWTVLLETIGVAGSWGPLAGKVKPMTGGVLFWARPGTIRLRPWKWVPFTAGDRRTWFDVGLYVALLISVAVPLLSPGVHSGSLSRGDAGQHLRVGPPGPPHRADSALDRDGIAR